MIRIRVRENNYYYADPEKVPWAEPGTVLEGDDNRDAIMPHYRVYPDEDDNFGWILWPDEAELVET